MNGKILQKSVLLGLLLTNIYGGWAYAGVYTPGATITDSNVVYTGTKLFDTAGTYTISNAADDTLTITSSAVTASPISLSSGTTVIDGNLNLDLQGNRGYNIIYFGGNNTSFTLEGDLKVRQSYDEYISGPNEAIRAYGGVQVTYNGDVEIDVHNKSNALSSSYTAFVAWNTGTVVTVTGNFYLKNQLDEYIGSDGGANGIYARDYAVLNFYGDETIIQTIGYKPDTISSKDHAVVNIASPKTQIIGSIDFGDNNGGTVNMVLDGSDSFWYGDELNGDASGTLNVTLQNGAEYIPFGTLAENDYDAKKYLSAITLAEGGVINLYDAWAQQKWQEYGLDVSYPDTMLAELDYIMVGDLKGTEGVFRLDMDSANKANTDMIYILASTEGEGQNNIQAYSENAYQGISADNTLRFASVAAAAADKLIFKDQMNIYGETLWDYQLLIGHEAYDEADPENAVYNSGRDGLSATDIDTLMAGGMNWYVYGYTKTPSTTTVTIMDAAGAGYDLATDLDRYNKRFGEAKFVTEEHDIWVRMKRAKIGRDGGYNGNYTMGQIGYETGDENNRYGIAIDYAQGKSALATNGGRSENKRKGIMLYDTITKDDGSYWDLVARYGRIDNDIHGYTAALTEIKGDYANNAYTLSVEYGKKLQKANSAVYFEPQAQLQYTRVTGANYLTSNGITAKIDAADSLIGRLGFRVGKEISKDSNVYFKADVLREFTGGQDVSLSASDGVAAYTYDGSVEKRGTWYDVGIGANIRLSKATYFTCDLERSFGSKLAANWEANVGVKWAF